MTDWKKIREEWETSDITFVDLAEKHNLKTSTVRSRKNREKWQRNDNATQHKNVATQKKKAAKKKESIAEEVKSVMENDDLTDKQRLFCIYYNKYFNATKAYQKAYEVDYLTANAHGYKLLSNVVIKEEINRLKQSKLNRAMFSEEDLFQMYLDIATADMNDFVKFGTEEVVARDKQGEPILDENGNETTYTRSYLEFKDCNKVDGTLISEISYGQTGPRIKLQDKLKAMEWLDKHIGIATEEQKLRIKKLKVDIEKVEGNEEELSKLDKILEGINNAAKS
jgi:phage terminase small subunit